MADLNYRIKTFNFSTLNINNKMPQINSDFNKKVKFSMSASEMACFVRVFNFLIGEYVENGDDYWKLYTYLRIITEIASADSINSGIINLLEFSIAEHNQLYIKLSESSLKPKFHFLCHYPRIMRRLDH